METTEPRPEPTPARLRAEARFLSAWALLRALQADEAQGLEGLAQEPIPPDLQRLAATLAQALREPRALGPVLRAHVRSLRAWVVPLLDASGARPDPALVRRAARILAREAEGSRARPTLLRQKLALLVAGRAGVAEGLAGLAQDEREREEHGLAAALEKVAREAGSRGWEALGAAREPFTPWERVVLARAAAGDDAGLASALEGLARVDRLGQDVAPGAALARVARAAAEKAKPVKKALEGVFSGIEGALGLDAPRAPRPAPSPEPARPEAASPPASREPELAARITVREVRRGPVKTIGPAGPDEGEPSPDPAPPDVRASERAREGSREQGERGDVRESQRAALEQARADFRLLEIEDEPDADAIRLLGGQLALLRDALAGARDLEGESLRRELDELELRFVEWRRGK